MITIIAGGRDYQLTEDDYAFLNELNEMTEIVSGGATGADHGGECYAKQNGIKLTVFAANWREYGKRAGPIRNEIMAQHAEQLVLFKGGRGTDNMYNNAVKHGLKIHDRRNT